MSLSYNNSGYVKNISINEAIMLMRNDKDLVILDVRTPEEFKSAHIKGAINIPSEQLTKRMIDIIKYKHNPILVYCKTGVRSSAVVVILSSYGFKKIYHMYEGISAWPHY